MIWHCLYAAVAYLGGFFGCPDPPPPRPKAIIHFLYIWRSFMPLLPSALYICNFWTPPPQILDPSDQSWIRPCAVCRNNQARIQVLNIVVVDSSPPTPTHPPPPTPTATYTPPWQYGAGGGGGRTRSRPIWQMGWEEGVRSLRWSKWRQKPSLT